MDSHEASTIITNMINVNQQLAGWERFDNDRSKARTSLLFKNPAKMAQLILSQLSHEAVVRLVASAWEALDPQVRMQLSTLANTGNASGAVRKNVQRLNALLGGKMLRELRDGVRINQRKEGFGADGPKYQTKIVNPAVAGAKRKYGLG